MHFGKCCFPLQNSLPVGWSVVGGCQGLTVQSVRCCGLPRKLLYCVYYSVWILISPTQNMSNANSNAQLDVSQAGNTILLVWRGSCLMLCYCGVTAVVYRVQTVACRRALCL